MTNIYGPVEHRYAAPVAEALAEDSHFSHWVLSRLGFADWHSNCQALKSEQKALRPKARFWWKNVFCSEQRCRCPNLRGREVDILVVFEHDSGSRLGLHIEVKHPGDRFHGQQAANYRERLSCWTRPDHGPRTIPEHQSARAVLLCDRANHFSQDQLQCFDAVLFFGEIAAFITPYPLPLARNIPG